MQLVFSVFPGGGKSTICNRAEQYGLKHVGVSADGVIDVPVPAGTVPVFDSDSSLFDKEYFPGNYIEHIKEVLSNYPNVVIMVSSHDNVRKAMAEAGIPYTLVYPERELKGDYLERYEGRGSPEAFVNMMDNKWNDFIDSTESDPSQDHIVLSEGEYLVDRISDRIKQAVEAAEATPVAGFESLTDHKVNADPEKNEHDIKPAGGPEVTAAIIEVNADADNPVHIQPTPTGDVVLPVIDIPEDRDDSIEETAALELAEPAIVASTVEDSALGPQDPEVAGNEDHIGTTGPVDGGEHHHDEDRYDLIEAKFDMENDIDMLDKVIIVAKDPEQAGFENLADNGEMMVSISTDIKDRYDIEVEPTVEGMEGFVETLKDAYNKLKEKVKGIPSKKVNAQIIKNMHEAKKMFDEYTTEKWQSEQSFKNVGKTKLQVPKVFKEINSISDVDTIIKMTTKRAVDIYDRHHTNGQSRLTAGMKIFNAFKNRPADTPISEVDEMLPIKPELLTGGLVDSGLKDFDTTLTPVELPVLTKASLKEVADVIDFILKTQIGFIESEEKYYDHSLDEDAFFDSDFWDAHLNSEQAKQVWNATEYHSVIDQMDQIEDTYRNKVLNVAQFLQRWILSSIK